MSYIVKNCPAKVDLYCYATENRQKFIYCQDCTDCLIKQIVELYKEQTQFCNDCSTWTCENCEFSTNGFAEELIELLDIQEAE